MKCKPVWRNEWKLNEIVERIVWWKTKVVPLERQGSSLTEWKQQQQVSDHVQSSNCFRSITFRRVKLGRQPELQLRQPRLPARVPRIQGQDRAPGSQDVGSGRRYRGSRWRPGRDRYRRWQFPVWSWEGLGSLEPRSPDPFSATSSSATTATATASAATTATTTTSRRSPTAVSAAAATRTSTTVDVNISAATAG